MKFRTVLQEAQVFLPVAPALRRVWQYWPALACLFGAGVFMLVATLFYWPTPEFAFLSDQSPVSWLSSAQLWALAVLALRLGSEHALPPLTSVWLFAAMVGMACDEQFMLHEQWKYGCFQWWSACRYNWVTELPMGLVGVLGVVSVIHLHFVMRSRDARFLLWSALAVGGLALSIDLFNWASALSWSEEGFEVLAEALFMGALIGLPAQGGRQLHSV